jgi:hypothetical protein
MRLKGISTLCAVLFGKTILKWVWTARRYTAATGRGAMTALTLWQPWPLLLGCGAKNTRPDQPVNDTDPDIAPTG